MIVRISPNEMESLGLTFAGFDLERQNVCNDEKVLRFRDAYGISAEAASNIFFDIHNLLEPTETEIRKPNAMYFFMTLNWLKTYQTRTSLKGKFKCNKTTVTKWQDKYVKAIQALKSVKVRFLFCFFVYPSQF